MRQDTEVTWTLGGVQFKALGPLGRAWNEDLHPRANDGRFSHGPGGLLSGHSVGGRGRAAPRSAMPDVIVSSRIPLEGGDLTFSRHADGSVTMATPAGSVTLDKRDVRDLHVALRGADDVGVGEETILRRIESRPEGAWSVPLARVVRSDRNSFTLQIPDIDDPSYEELQRVPGLTASKRDLEKIDDVLGDLDAAARIDTRSGPVDLFVSDDNTFGFRVPDSSGHPVELHLDPKSFAKLQHAHDVVFDGFDESDTSPDAPDSGVTRVEVPTNVGKVRVEVFGEMAGTDEWNGKNPGDRIEIAAADGSWGITLEGAGLDAWHEATSELEGVGEMREIYDPQMKWKSRWTVGGITFKAGRARRRPPR